MTYRFPPRPVGRNNRSNEYYQRNRHVRISEEEYDRTFFNGRDYTGGSGKPPSGIFDFENGYFEQGGKRIPLEDAMEYTSTSHKTMIDFEGKLVYAPHNLIEQSQPVAADMVNQSATVTDAPNGGVSIASTGPTYVRAGVNTVAYKDKVRYTHIARVERGSSDGGRLTVSGEGLIDTTVFYNVLAAGAQPTWTAELGTKNLSAEVVAAGSYLDIIVEFEVDVAVASVNALPAIGPASDVVGEDIILHHMATFRSDLPMSPDPDTGELIVTSVDGPTYKDRRNHHENGQRAMWVEAEGRANQFLKSLDLRTANTGILGTATRFYDTPDPNGGLMGMTVTTPTNDDGVMCFSEDSVIAGDARTGSAWLRIPEGMTAEIGIARDGGNPFESTFVPVVGTGEWQRYEATHVFTGPHDRYRLQVRSKGAAPTQSFELAWPQIEAGRYASSFIPTYDIVVNRDVELMRFLDIFQPGGTFYIDCLHAKSDDGDFGRAFEIAEAGQSADRFSLLINSSVGHPGTLGAETRLGVGGGQAYVDIRKPYLGDPWRSAHRLATDDFANTFDGKLNTDDDGTYPPEAKDLYIAGGGANWNAKGSVIFPEFRIWDKDNTLTNEEMLELTEMIPLNTTPPVVTPSQIILGQEVVATPGVWAYGDVPTGQWYLGNRPVGGAFTLDFTPTQLGNYTYRETIRNSQGSTTAISNVCVVRADSVYAVGGKLPEVVIDPANGRFERRGEVVRLDDLGIFDTDNLRTLVDADGQVKFAPHNMNIFSEPLASQVNIVGSPDVSDQPTGLRIASTGTVWHRVNTNSQLWENGVNYTIATEFDRGTSDKLRMELNVGADKMAAIWNGPIVEDAVPFLDIANFEVHWTSMKEVSPGVFLAKVNFTPLVSATTGFGVGPNSTVSGEYIDMKKIYTYRSGLGGMKEDWDSGSDYVFNDLGKIRYRDRRECYEFDEDAVETELISYTKLEDAKVGATSTEFIGEGLGQDETVKIDAGATVHPGLLCEILATGKTMIDGQELPYVDYKLSGVSSSGTRFVNFVCTKPNVAKQDDVFSQTVFMQLLAGGIPAEAGNEIRQYVHEFDANGTRIPGSKPEPLIEPDINMQRFDWTYTIEGADCVFIRNNGFFLRCTEGTEWNITIRVAGLQLRSGDVAAQEFIETTGDYLATTPVRDRHWQIEGEIHRNDLQNSLLLNAELGRLNAGGSLPSGWTVAAGITSAEVEVVALGKERGMPYIDLRFDGTPTGDITLIYAGSFPSAADGDIWTHGLYARLMAGNKGGIANFQIGMDARAANAYHSSYGSVVDNSLTKLFIDMLTNEPYLFQYTSAPLDDANGPGSIDEINCFLRWTGTNGNDVDFTVRLYGMMFQKSRYRTSFIPTDAASVELVRERWLSVAGLIGNQGNSWFWDLLGATANEAFGRIMEANDGQSSANRNNLYVARDNDDMAFGGTNNAVSQYVFTVVIDYQDRGPRKVASRIKDDDGAATSSDRPSVLTDSDMTWPPSVSTFRIGTAHDGANPGAGAQVKLKQASIWLPELHLTDDDLQAVTRIT